MGEKKSRQWVGFQKPSNSTQRKIKFSQPQNPALVETVGEVVDNQLRDRNPPEVKLTFDRLVAEEGFSEVEARRLIGGAMLVEMNEMLRDKRFFDEARYTAMLKRLPDLPTD